MRGAAGLLIDWGIQQARNCNSFIGLEASRMGQPIYSRHGFHQLGDWLEYDCRPYGIEGEFALARMFISPTAKEANRKGEFGEEARVYPNFSRRLPAESQEKQASGIAT